MRKKKVIIFTAVLIAMSLSSYFLFFSSPHYKIFIPIRKNLFIVKADQEQSIQSSQNHSGICPPPGCGNPYGSKGRENITLVLSSEQITSLLNQYKPASILFTNIKVNISGQTIFTSATSLYPFLPGQLSASARLYLNHFYINDAYVGNVKAPAKIANLIEANGDKSIKDMFAKYSIWLNKMELVDGKLNFTANVPKGMITVDQDGTILINLPEIPKNQNDSVNQNPNTRF